MSRYCLAWQHADTGEVRRGSTVFESREAARQAADKLDASWPEIRHWVVEVGRPARRPLKAEACA